MSGGWTPGPWRIHPEYETMISNCAEGIEAADICEVSEWPLEYRAERNANACLIAAAPELVEALRGFVEPYADMSDADIIGALYLGQETVDARALLTRIEGGAA